LNAQSHICRHAHICIVTKDWTWYAVRYFKLWEGQRKGPTSPYQDMEEVSAPAGGRGRGGRGGADSPLVDDSSKARAEAVVAAALAQVGDPPACIVTYAAYGCSLRCVGYCKVYAGCHWQGSLQGWCEVVAQHCCDTVESDSAAKGLKVGWEGGAAVLHIAPQKLTKRLA
jgi:hypothetical protein